MNYKTLLTSSFLVIGFSAAAQNAATYAITGNGDFQWANIRQVDIASGKLVKDIFQNNKTAFTLLNAATKAPVTQLNFKYNNNGTPVVAQVPDAPTLTMVAAAAYDKRHGKLFFTPMRIGELRWMDVSTAGETPKFYAEKATLLNDADLSEEANHITRMDIAADGNGYAITNDGNHFIRFTTGKKTIITDLGALVDAETNSGISIHNRCTSWGGDMVADAYGKLYIISASHSVFKVDIDSRTATYLGVINGLPANYTTNGAAVSDEGKVVVSSANSYEGFYTFDIKDLAAVKVEGSDKYTASDLANGNLLYQKEVDAKRSLGVTASLPVEPINTDARIFPNPVTNNEFKVLFDNFDAGMYMITVTDLSGRAVYNKQAQVSGKMQAITVNITNTLGKGVYFVKVANAAKQVVFTERVVIQ
jgi:hypothetical protein